MTSLRGIHFLFDIPFVHGGGDAAHVSRSLLCLPRKLTFRRAKHESALDGLLHEDHGSISAVDVIEDLPHLPDTERQPVRVSTAQSGRYDALRLRTKLRVSVPGPSGSLPPNVLYLLEFGLDHEQIKMIVGKYPSFAYCSLERKIMPLIEFLLDLGVPKSDIPNILIRCPGLCGMRLSENLIPTMEYLETLGVEKSRWVKLMSSYPAAVTYSRQKIEAAVEFLYEVGLAEDSIGKILTRCPQILGHSVEDKLRPTAEYFQSLGADFAVVLRNYPKILSLSIEAKLKPTTEFFIEKGFSNEEVGTMARFGHLYSYSLKDNLVPKWEFFMTMDYPREDLVKFPNYFSYSLKERIKPRYNLMKESDVKLSLSQLLSTSSDRLELLLKKKSNKLQLNEWQIAVVTKLARI